jgi:nicotinate-nucleotide adenylyltransferase
LSSDGAADEAANGAAAERPGDRPLETPLEGPEGPAIALFGTSADPPTLGHRSLLEGLLALYPQVVTWASDNPLKHHGASLEQRAALLQTLVAAIGDPRLSLRQELSSPWAIDTLANARRLWPGRPLVFVVGSDLADQIPRWKQAKAVLAACRLAIVPRCGWPIDPEALERLRSLGARPQLLALQIPASASSDLRRALAGGAITPAADPAALPLPAELQPLLLLHNPYDDSAR